MPLTNKEATKKLKEIFQRPGSTIIPGGVTPWHAIMVERAGYEAFYISGGLSHQQILGWPDSGLLYPTDFVDNARRVVKAVKIPVFSDADTAGGNAVNVYRTVQEYIWAGLAGCHIEDVEYPKGVSTTGQEAARQIHENARIVPVEEAVGRLKAALAARDELDPNFVVIGRTDARNAIGGGFDEAVRRANTFAALGVDVLMFDGMHTWDECKKAIDSVKLPCFFTGAFFTNERDAQGQWVPMPTVQQRAKDGEKIYLAVGLGLQTANQATWETLVGFKQRGTQVLEEWRQGVDQKPAEMRLPADIIRKDRLWELQEKFLPKPSA